MPKSSFSPKYMVKYIVANIFFEHIDEGSYVLVEEGTNADEEGSKNVDEDELASMLKAQTNSSEDE